MNKQKKSNKSPLKILSLIIILIIGIFTYSKFKNTKKEKQNQTIISEQTQKEIFYTNQNLGIKFAIQHVSLSDIKTKNNRIYVVDDEGNYPLGYLDIFTKKTNQTIEDAILDIVETKGKDSKKCIVINDGLYANNNDFYRIDLVNKNIIYTNDELNKIKQAEKMAKDLAWYEQADIIKKEIYYSRLIETCSEYAKVDSGSRDSYSGFLFNKKNKFVFKPGMSGTPYFHKMETIELFE